MKRLILLALPVLFLSACSTKYIGNTRIEDTADNREVLRVVEQYRRAVEDRDVERIMGLTSDRFFEDPGTPNIPGDDYDKAGLRDRLDEAFSRVQDQRLVVDVRRITYDDSERRVNVDYRFDYRYRLDLPHASQWREQSDLNRLVLERESEGWRIVSGL